MLVVRLEDCRAENSWVIHDSGAVNYGEIVASGTLDRRFSEEELKALPRKAPGERKLLGVDVPALDIPEKANGDAVYGIDVEVEGMVYTGGPLRHLPGLACGGGGNVPGCDRRRRCTEG